MPTDSDRLLLLASCTAYADESKAVQAEQLKRQAEAASKLRSVTEKWEALQATRSTHGHTPEFAKKWKELVRDMLERKQHLLSTQDKLSEVEEQRFNCLAKLVRDPNDRRCGGFDTTSVERCCDVIEAMSANPVTACRLYRLEKR